MTGAASTKPSAWRAWQYLVQLSWKRQARAHLLVWISLGLLAFMSFVVLLNTAYDRWNMTYWPIDRKSSIAHISYWYDFVTVQQTFTADPHAQMIRQMVGGAYYATFVHGSGFYVFSRWIVLSIFTTFLLPIWCLSFATEGLGRERESRNLGWLLMRPIPRPSIYFAKYIAMLPWALLLCFGGYALLCLCAGAPGHQALQVYWPAVLLGTLAFTSLFHLMGALFRRPAVVAILYAFFLESFVGNLPGNLKRFSISFFVRCVMYDRAQGSGIQPNRPSVYLPVQGATALLVLTGITIGCLAIGMWVFARKEYIENA